jgi:hypothetical protein
VRKLSRLTLASSDGRAKKRGRAADFDPANANLELIGGRPELGKRHGVAGQGFVTKRTEIH